MAPGAQRTARWLARLGGLAAFALVGRACVESPCHPGPPRNNTVTIYGVGYQLDSVTVTSGPCSALRPFVEAGPGGSAYSGTYTGHAPEPCTFHLRFSSSDGSFECDVEARPDEECGYVSGMQVAVEDQALAGDPSCFDFSPGAKPDASVAVRLDGGAD